MERHNVSINILALHSVSKRSAPLVIGIPTVVCCMLLCSFFTACDRATERIKEAINEQWPPVSSFDRRAQALAASDLVLQSLKPVVYVSWDRDALDRIPAVIESQLRAAKATTLTPPIPDIKNVTVRAEQEGISVRCDFVLEIATPAVVVSGRLDGQMTVAPAGNVLQPAIAFNKVEVRDLKWTKGPVDAQVAVPAINSIVRSTVDNVNGAIKLQLISLALGPIAPLDPQTIKVQGLTVTGSKIDLPIPTVSGISILASEGTLQVMADLRLPGEPPSASIGTTIPPSTQAEFDSELKKFQNHFETLRDNTFGTESDGTKAAITRSYIALVLNTAINNKALHLNYAFPEQKQPFDSDIRPYNAPQINCDSQEDTRNCRPPNPCSLSHDERSCGHDINIGGWNIIKQHVNDPVCEAAKAAQNQIYLRSFDACNAGYTVSITSCEAAKASQNAIYAAKKAACEVDKARLEAIEKLAHVGHISGDFSASGTAIADIYNFGASPSLDTITMDTAVSGSANVLAHVKFDPDTAGHLACTTGWDKELRTTVSVQQQPFPVKGTIGAGDDGALLVSLKGSSIFIQLNPPPVQAMFGAHPELVVNCAPLVGIESARSLIYQAFQPSDVPNEISGRYQVAIPDSKFNIPLQTLSFKVGNEDINLKPRLLAKAAWFTTP